MFTFESSTVLSEIVCYNATIMKVTVVFVADKNVTFDGVNYRHHFSGDVLSLHYSPSTAELLPSLQDFRLPIDVSAVVMTVDTTISN